MRSDLFTHEAQKTSAVFGRNTDLQVVFQGQQACTNGKTVYLPAIDQRAELSDETAAVMRGYIDHEAGHVRHTNFRALNRFANKATPLERGIHNAIEDVWLEQRVRAEYPGSTRNLRATTTAVNQQFLDEVEPDDPRNADPRFISAVAITWAGRREYGGETCEACLERVPDELRAKVEQWVAKIDRCKSTSDTIKLAKRIASEIETAAAEAEQQRSAESSDRSEHEGSDDQDDDRGSDERSEDETGDDDATPNAGERCEEDDGGDEQEAAASASDESEDDEGDEAEAEQRGVGQDGIEPYEPDAAKAVEKLLENEGLTGSGSGYKPYSTAFDKWHHRSDEPGKHAGKHAGSDVDDTFGVRMADMYSRQAYQQRSAEMGSVVAGMRRKLERALLSMQRRDWDAGREHGRLDSRRFASAVAGRSNVFKMRSERAELDTAVSILVDMSGSMNGDKARLATKAVIAMAEALDRPGIPFEVLGFNNRSHFLGTSRAEMDAIQSDFDHLHHERYMPLDMYEFKRFDERLSVASGVLWQIERHVDGSNSDGEAVLSAWRRLRERPESRRVMLVLSDGQPACAGNKSMQANYLGDVVRRIEASDGDDIVGIGIMDNSVRQFYERSVVVYELEELAGTAMDQLAKLLMGERFVVDNRKMGMGA